MNTLMPTDNRAILGLHEAGKSSRQIETILGVDHATVCRRLKNLTPRKTTEIFRAYRADILAEKQRQILMLSTTSDAQNGRDQRDYATTLGIYYDKERLERGQSTGNIQVIQGLSAELQGSLDTLIQRLDPPRKTPKNAKPFPPPPITIRDDSCIDVDV